MDCTEAYREHIMYSFNGFCKRSNSLKREIDELNREAQNIETALGISFDESGKSQNSGRERDEHSAEQ